MLHIVRHFTPAQRRALTLLSALGLLAGIAILAMR